MTKLIGWIVVARKRGTRDAWKQVSGAFQIKSSAETYLDMYGKANPSQEVYVSTQLRKDGKD